MKKLFTSFVVAMTAILGLTAQVRWDQVKISTTEIPLADTAYFSIICRGGGFQAMSQVLPDTLYGAANPGVTVYQPGDSLLWYVVKGASLGITPRIRLVNARTGQYMYMGTKGGTVNRPYMAGLVDPFNGLKDFLLEDRGPRVPAEYYYAFTDAAGNRIGNPSAGVFDVANSSKAADAKYMWRFNKKMGPVKPARLPAPALGLSTVETELNAGGSATVKAKVTKGAADLTGQALLYYQKTLLDTLDLNAQGEATYTYSGLNYGSVSFVLVYTNDPAYEPVDSILTMKVGPNANAKYVNVAVTPAVTSSEVHKDLAVNFAITDTQGNPVPEGMVYVTVNKVVKNSFTPDVLGTGSIVFPNLLMGADTIGAYYIGDKEDYRDSDTTYTVVNIVPSTSNVIPYPVYFDLGSMYEFRKYTNKYITTSSTRVVNINFAADSLQSISLSTDTAVTKTYMAQLNNQALSYTNSDLKDMRCAADQVSIPFGISPRPNWVNIKTPWLNAGSYNIYISQRVNTASGMFPTVSLDGKVVYYPNAELIQPSFRTYAGNNVRRWNAKGHKADLGMHYFGTVNTDKNGVHDLKFVIQKGGEMAWLDMIQFIPVDQDSLVITKASSAGLAKVYYPLFDLGGFARFAGDATVITAMADITELAVPYQAADLTTYTKYPYTISNLGKTTVNELVGDYAVVYKAEDKWTRVAEGRLENNAFNGELPAGDYYYEELNYIDMGTPGAAGYRTVITTGTFSVGNSAVDVTNDRPSIYAYTAGRTLNVRGFDAGARVLVTDLTGRTLINTVVNGDSFAATMPQGVYLVKVVSKEVLKTKVIIK